jgi:hypothetical protein
VVAQSAHGIILAAENRAIQLNEKGEEVSFILAGKTAKDRAKPFRLYYLWTQKKLPQLDGDEISNAFSLHRRMGLEFQLNQLSKGNASLEAILARIKEGIEKLKSQ